MAPPSGKSQITTISVSPEMRDALAALKPRGRSFEDLLELLVEERSLQGWKEKLERMEETELAKIQARKARIRSAPGVLRDPSEQRMLAEAASERWRRWEAVGRVRKTDDRKWTYEARPRGGSRARIRRTG